MATGTNLDVQQPASLDDLARAFAQLDPERRADLAQQAAQLLAQQEGERQ